jgi:hypothetical protein
MKITLAPPHLLPVRAWSFGRGAILSDVAFSDRLEHHCSRPETAQSKLIPQRINISVTI